MNNEIVSAALKTLNIDVDSVSGELTDDQIKEFTDKISQAKVYDEATLNDLKSNVRKDFRSTIEKEVSGKTLSKFEKDAMQKYGLELKQGEDYQNAIELIDKIVSTKVSESSTDETLTKELTTLREALKAKEEEKTTSNSALEQAYKKQINDMKIDNVLAGVATKLDVSDELKSGQLEFIKYNFDKSYSLGEQDGQIVVLDKTTNEVIKNETDYSPESLSSVINRLAPTLVKFKTDDNKTGRADEIINGKTTNDRAFSTLKSYDDFNKHLTDKGISPTSLEGQESYAKWRKSQGDNITIV